MRCYYKYNGKTSWFRPEVKTEGNVQVLASLNYEGELDRTYDTILIRLSK